MCRLKIYVLWRFKKLHFGIDFKVLVCNYGPSGNIIGGRMYAKGEPGSLCPNGSENGLCL